MWGPDPAYYSGRSIGCGNVFHCYQSTLSSTAKNHTIVMTMLLRTTSHLPDPAANTLRSEIRDIASPASAITSTGPLCTPRAGAWNHLYELKTTLSEH